PPALLRIESKARVGAEERGEEPHPEFRIASLAREHQIEELFAGCAGRPSGEVLVKPLPHPAARPGRSEAEERLPFRRRARRLLAGRDRPQSGREPLQLRPLPLLELLELASSARVELLERLRPAAVELGERLLHSA